MVSKYVLCLIGLLLFLSSPSHSVPPPPDSPPPTISVCKVNPVAIQKRTLAIRAAPFFQVPMSPTTSYLLVLRVDFSDQATTKSQSQVQQMMENLKQFYWENSYGVFTVSATVTNKTYRLPSPLSSYGNGICSNYDQLVKDAVSAAAADYNFSTYQHILIYHSGIGAETANDSGCQTNNIWSVFAPTVPATSSQSDGVRYPLTANGVYFNGASIIPESELRGIDPFGVLCHEYGHQLGLPDLYLNGSQSVIGKWSLMDNGVYLGNPPGSNPSHLDAWSKQFLGFFSNPQTVVPTNSGMNVSLALALSTGDAYIKIPIQGVSGVDGNKEYFLMERRAHTSFTGKTFDDFLPLGSSLDGTLIWHIDDSIATDPIRLAANNINNGSPHFGVSLVEAGGDGSSAMTSGKDSDPYPGSTNKTIFAAPHSNSFSGQQTGIVVAGFSGGEMTIKKAYSADSISISRAINYPNPGGPSYPQKFGASPQTVTTIVLNTTRAAQNIRLTLHDLTGTLVRDVPASLIQTNAAAITTNKFVYEFDWDGKNDSGDTVAPGIYLYRFKVDDSTTQTGKCLLIR